MEDKLLPSVASQDVELHGFAGRHFSSVNEDLGKKTLCATATMRALRRK